jgi:predicted RNA-binding protein with PIN domain
MQKMIVDGYNVIHADPDLKRTMQKDPQGARRALIRRLAKYLENKSVQLSVVFDGHGGITDVDVEIPGKLQILFSPEGQSADELILEIMEASSHPRRYIVVTSDVADIGRAAGALGAEVVASQEFLSRIRPHERRNGHDAVDAVADDVDYWLERFGEDRNDREDD